jgi:hypothetical protein
MGRCIYHDIMGIHDIEGQWVGVINMFSPMSVIDAILV